MKKIQFLLMTLIAGLVVSCGGDDDPITPPNAAFSFSIDDKTVTFTNSSTNATSYAWDFGDSNSSTEENPMHTYSDIGSFNAVLTATNSGGSDSRTITVDLISAFQNNWTVTSADQTTTSDFPPAWGGPQVQVTSLDNAQSNFVLSYVLGEIIAANTNALALSLEQGGAVKLDNTATNKSTWEEIAGELGIDSSVAVVADNDDSIVGVLNADGTVTLTIGSLGLLSAWPSEFHITDAAAGGPGQGAFVTSVTTVNSIIVELSAN